MTSTSTNKLVLGRYRVVKKIGAGGMGDVYEAFDVERSLPVALKTVVVEKLTDANRIRLEREAEALSRFSHPNIVGFHGLTTQARMIYCVMELIRGEALSKLIERVWRIEKTGMPIDVLERVAECVAAALHHAHEQAVLHRDIKPDNILVDVDGRPVLTDFGLAKVKDLFSVTQAGQALGTVVYFAPEQMRGEPADERTDIYQLGLTLYETATGILPFGDEPPLAAMKRRIKEPVPPPTSLNPAVPLHLDAAIRMCLQPRPAARFQSMTELLDVLQTRRVVELPEFGALSKTDNPVVKRPPAGEATTKRTSTDRGKRPAKLVRPVPAGADASMEPAVTVTPVMCLVLAAALAAIIALVVIF